MSVGRYGAGTIAVEVLRVQRVTVALEDDLTGGSAEQTVGFAFDGTDYEIDLSAKNAAAFGKQLAPLQSTPARRPGQHRAGLGGPLPTANATVIFEPGPRSTAWRSKRSLMVG